MLGFLALGVGFLVIGLMLPDIYSSIYFIAGIFILGLVSTNVASDTRNASFLIICAIGCAAIATVKAISHYSGPSSKQPNSLDATTQDQSATSSSNRDYFADRAHFFVQEYETALKVKPGDPECRVGLETAKRLYRIASITDPGPHVLAILISEMHEKAGASQTWKAMTHCAEALLALSRTGSESHD